VCIGNANPVGVLGGDLGISESGSVRATIIGSTAKCTVNVAYSWPLTSPPDRVALSYVLNYAVEGGENRSSSRILTSIPVPVNGSTVHVPITATI
jgi:hypothetical protein